MYNGHTERLTESERAILSLIGEGKENGTSLRALCSLSCLPEREIRHLIEHMRRVGVPVLSGMSGYYFPETSEEIREYIRKEEKRARSIFYTLRGAKQALSAYEKEETRNAGAESLAVTDCGES